MGIESSDRQLHVVVGCGSYDGSVIALDLINPMPSNSGKAQLLRPCFIDTMAHNGAVRAIAVHGDSIVSGGSDEMIQLFSRASKTRLAGGLDHHSGSIRQLLFAPPVPGFPTPHLFSSSDDSAIAIWRHDVSSSSSHKTAWECIRLLRRHKGPVLSLAIHPSCRIAFSIGSDKLLRVWNLLRGRQAYATRLKSVTGSNGQVAQAIDVSPTGRYLMLIWPSRFDIVDLMNSSSTPDIDRDAQYQALGSVHLPQNYTAQPVFHSEDHDAADGESVIHVLVGLGRSLTAFCLIKTPENSCVEPAGDLIMPGRRVKAIQINKWPDWMNSGTRSRLVTILTTDIDGSYLRGYAVDFHKHKKLDIDQGSVLPVFEHNLPSIRLTAMAVDLVVPGNNLEKSVDDEDLSEEEAEEKMEEYETSDSE